MSAPEQVVVFRVTGLLKREAEETVRTLTNVIKENLLSSELDSLTYEISPVPYCYRNDRSAALVDFQNGVPAFLRHVEEKSLDGCHVKTMDGDINFDRHFFGFTQLYFTEPSQAVTADIIAITGLSGHAYGSWMGKLDPRRMWLRDFLSMDLPNCRTLSYGYDSRLLRRGVDTISTYGLEFMEGLKIIRNTTELRQRPLIFIAHSFGGLLLAHCLVKACQSHEGDHPTIAALYKATYGILFFATPHRGLLIEDMRSLVAGEIEHPRLEILREIDLESELLISQLADLKNLIRDRKIVSFFETEETRKLKWDPESERWKRTGDYVKLVPINSGALQLPIQMEDQIPLHSSHSNIVKFDSENALGYIFALEKLRIFQNDAAKIVADRFSGLSICACSGGAETETKPVFTVPFDRDLMFVGRNEVVKTIGEQLQCKRRVALCGIGGIGKSQIAIEYCYIWKENNVTGHVLWVDAGTRDRFEESFKNIALHLAIPGRDDPKLDTLKLVHDWLCDEGNGPWLIALDNADDMEMFFGLKSSADGAKISSLNHIAELLPRSINGFIIVTTRDQRVGQRLTSHVGIISVPALDLQEAESLLEVKMSQRFNPSEVDNHKLLRTLGCIPLAISQAAAFMMENFMTVSAYIEAISKSDLDLQDYLDEDLPDPRRDPASENSVIRTWKLSFDKIKRQNQRAADLLSLMAVLDRQAIPKTLLQQEGERSIDFNKALGTLQAFSLISTVKDGALLEVHRLVHVSTQRWLALQGSQGEWQEKAMELMVERFPSGECDTWESCKVLSPHARSLIRCQYTAQQTLLRRAEVMSRLARYDTFQGRYESALFLYEEAQEMQYKLLGLNSIGTLRSIQGLAYIFFLQGNYQEAEIRIREFLDQEWKLPDTDHNATMIAFDGSEGVPQYQCMHNKAERMYRQALGLGEKEVGLKHQRKFDSAEILALVLLHQGKHMEAGWVLRQTLDLRSEILGPKHPDVLSILKFLALIQYPVVSL